MDQGDSLTHRLYFGLPDGEVGGMDLAVDIGLRDMVQINQRQLPDTTAGKGLGGPRTDTTQSDHHPTWDDRTARAAFTP